MMNIKCTGIEVVFIGGERRMFPVVNVEPEINGNFCTYRHAVTGRTISINFNHVVLFRSFDGFIKKASNPLVADDHYDNPLN